MVRIVIVVAVAVALFLGGYVLGVRRSWPVVRETEIAQRAIQLSPDIPDMETHRAYELQRRAKHAAQNVVVSKLPTDIPDMETLRIIDQERQASHRTEQSLAPSDIPDMETLRAVEQARRASHL